MVDFPLFYVPYVKTTICFGVKTTTFKKYKIKISEARQTIARLALWADILLLCSSVACCDKSIHPTKECIISGDRTGLAYNKFYRPTYVIPRFGKTRKNNIKYLLLAAAKSYDKLELKNRTRNKSERGEKRKTKANCSKCMVKSRR